MLIMWQASPWTASLTASRRVGWACTIAGDLMHDQVPLLAKVSSRSSSVTSGPMRWAPRSSSKLGVSPARLPPHVPGPPTPATARRAGYAAVRDACLVKINDRYFGRR